MASFSRIYPISRILQLASSAFDSLSFCQRMQIDLGIYDTSHICQTGINRSGFQLQYLQGYSRPRGPLWRGRKLIGKEALHALVDVKRYKNDNVRLGNMLQSKVARLLKNDLLAVLAELQRQNEIDLALRVFSLVRNEIWYKPDVYLYKDMLNCLAKNKRVTDCETLLKDLKKEGITPDSLLLTEIMTAYLECQMLPQAMEMFEEMRRGSVPPDRPAFKVLMKFLKKFGKKELRLKIRKEYLEFYEGIEDGDEDFQKKMNEPIEDTGY